MLVFFSIALDLQVCLYKFCTSLQQQNFVFRSEHTSVDKILHYELCTLNPSKPIN